MTTSNSTVFNQTRDQLIAGALRMLGVVAQGESPNAVQITEASEALNMMVKAFEADGMPLWGLTEYTLTMTTGVSKYQIGVGKMIDIPKPLKVFQAWNRNNTSHIDIPMRILTKQEYNMLGNKETAGNPIQIYYNPLLDYGELNLFPTPSATDVATAKIVFVYQRPFEDFLISGNTPDFPQEWLEALKYGLAVRLAPEYGIDAEARKFLIQEYASVKAIALSFGVEEGSIYLQVDRRNY